MKIQKKWVAKMAGLGFLFISVVTLKAQSKTAIAVATNPGFALLELFTSEGCSSCPPAEALLEQVDHSSMNQPVYVLAYHVDYWDRLGWKDTFSKHQFSLRQYNYSQKFSGQVYTPQLVINGTKEGVGSDQEFVEQGIGEALATPAEVTLMTQLYPAAGTKGHLSYAINGTVGKTKLFIAVVKKRAISLVTSGENKGRTLSHAGIVKELTAFTVGLQNKGAIDIALPNDYNQQDYDIISFLQQTQTGRVVAASKVIIHG